MKTLPLLVCAALATLLQSLPAQASFTEIYAFGDLPDAQMPGGLARGPDGALYGISGAGGANNYGAVFRIQPPSAPGGVWTETVLYSFTILSGGSGGSGGQFPTPVFGPAGALYGATAGTIFQLLPPDAPGGPWTETLLYSFPLPAADPSLIMGSDGTLYGFAYGGAYDQGMIFALSPPQSPGGPWAEQAIYNFTGTVDGSTPLSLITGPNGVLYGTTAFGGSYNDGVLFQLSPPARPRTAWLQTVLFNFPIPNLFLGAIISLFSNGVIYGTFDSSTGYSLIQFQPATGGDWTQTVLYTFPPNRTVLSSPLILRHGNLFGTTSTINSFGDQAPGGDVFELQKPAASGDPWTEVIIHHFQQRDSPHGSIVFDTSGVIYGTTYTSNAAPHQGYAYQLILPAAN